jgi:predicted nucleic acid-binding protein
MIVCIDTNVLLQAAKAGHPYEIIMQGWLSRRYQWAVSTSILAEYRELITHRSGVGRWRELERVFDLADRLGGLLIHCTPHYQFHIITADPADYVITNDTHFNALATAGYKPQPIAPEEFIRRQLEEP